MTSVENLDLKSLLFYFEKDSYYLELPTPKTNKRFLVIFVDSWNLDVV